MFLRHLGRPSAALVSAGLALAALAGCAPAPIEPVELEPLSCVDGAWNGGPLRDAVVDCSAPHSFDIVGSIGEWAWDAAAFDVADVAARDIYARLVRAEAGDPLAEAYRAWADAACADRFVTLLGLDTVSAGELTAAGVRPRPIGPYVLIHALSSADQYERGDRTTVCAVAWIDEAGQRARVAHEGSADLRSLVRPGFTSGMRECFLAESGTTTPISCAEPHSGQRLIEIDALGALGSDWITRVDPDTGRASDYHRADEVCADVLADLAPQLTLGDGLAPWADIRPTDGWVDFDGSVDTAARYPLSCGIIVSGQNPLLEGDMWDAMTGETASSGDSPTS